MLEAKLKLLENTNLVDFAIEVYRKLHDTEEAPASFLAKREAVVARLREEGVVA